MKYVEETKLLGELVSMNMKNEKSFKSKTNKAHEKKIKDTINERPYGIHTFKAAMLLRKGILLGSLLSNIETMVNFSKDDLNKLENPDPLLQEKLLLSGGNASNAFRYLDIGITPVKYVIMEEKKLEFFKYILDENIKKPCGDKFTRYRKMRVKLGTF